MKTFAKFMIPAIAAITLLPACSDDPSKGEPINIELTRSETEAVNAVNDFTFDFLKAVDNNFGSQKPNYIMSPQSVAWVVAMIANGAEDDSETLREMLDVLHLGDGATLQDVNDYSLKLIEAITSKNGSATVGVANALHYKSAIGINPAYVNILKTFYKAGEFPDPTNDRLDSWISDRTNGMIKDFAQKKNIEKYDFGVLNTIYFDGVWKERFDPKNTKEREFRNADGTKSMPLMMSEEQQGMMSQDEKCHFLKLFFNNESFAISFVIPTEGYTLDDVLKHLDGEKWRNLLGNGQRSTYSVVMPKLELKSDFDFVETAKDLGLKKAFSTQTELTKIAANPIMLTVLDQASVLKLDESGVKVATVSHGGGLCMAVLNDTFLLDEPFLYFITEESTGAILFTGKVSQL